MDEFSRLYRMLNRAELWESEITLARGEYLVLPGQCEKRLFFVRSGSLKVSIDQDGKEHIIRFGYPGSFITALDSFITGEPSDFYIQALKQCALLSINKAKYQTFLQADLERQSLWQRMMELLILQQLEREKDLLCSSPRQRYLRVQGRSPRLFQEIPHKYIASYLRMSPETLSRLKKS